MLRMLQPCWSVRPTARQCSTTVQRLQACCVDWHVSSHLDPQPLCWTHPCTACLSSCGASWHKRWVNLVATA